MSTDAATVRASLSQLDFPASKEALVEYAENNGADSETVRALRALPLGDYESIGDVTTAVPKDRSVTEGQSDSDKAKQARNARDNVAEHEVEVSENPIVEELGENRGS
ncbi:DUF2795 domain-containing protein [Allosaccharopolyspora coralli]|uniref:DUF2795 domain-containing protein n=1 Tax=Allosaccharopolyspora coralli TaxID=2665642 RepID=A0A5Q3QDM4_9PSEU|nr:DUF2795 domain-containing protein [Allosaccharopolyspora coralli]QGK69595.1 DUF2795 domain-containing protein [Allosaccharopolyspora coralli]